LQYSLCVQVLRSPILAASLHGTPAAGSTKFCGVVQRMELPNFRRRRHLYSAGRPSFGASAHILVLSFFPRLLSAVAKWMSTVLPHIIVSHPDTRPRRMQEVNSERFEPNAVFWAFYSTQPSIFGNEFPSICNHFGVWRPEFTRH